VTVADGQLTLLLDDLGGSDPLVMINALDIVAVAGGASASSMAGSTTASLNSLPILDEPLAWRPTFGWIDFFAEHLQRRHGIGVSRT
jgi:hypothetical protein